MRFACLLLVMAASGVSSLCAENCLAFDSTGVCIVCNFGRGFYPSGNGDCLSSTIQGCATYDVDGGCAACQAGWVRNGCGCIRGEKEDCQFISGKECLLCSEGQYPDGDACEEVERAIPHCVLYGSETSCVACEQGFYAWQGVCVPGEENCLVHTGPVCSYCAEGFRLISTIFDSIKDYSFQAPEAALLGQFPAYQFECVPVYTNCAVPTYGIDNVCKFCKTGYYLTTPNNCVEVDEEIPHCLYYAAGDECEQCEPFYVLVNDWTCQPAAVSVPNCLHYSEVNVCARCNANYFVLNPTTCEPVPTGLLVTNCAVYTSAGGCQYCSVNYYLVGSVCVQRPSPTTNCARNDLNGCTMCVNGYYLASPTSCVATTAVANCARYSSASVCAMCLDDYYLNGGACVQFNTIAGCLVYASATACKFCRTNMYLSSPTACAAVTTAVANCLYASTATTCQQCANNYFLSASGDECAIHAPNNCQIFTDQNVCSHCLIPYYYDASSNLCVVTTAVARCARYANAATCEFCEYGFYLQSNVCLPHTIAFTTQFDNCIRFDDDSCTACATGYYWQEDAWQCRSVVTAEQVPNCAVYAATSPGSPTASQCVECTANNYLFSGSCLSANRPINSCEAYDATNNCVRCAPNYFLETATSCRIVPPANRVSHCLIYASLTACEACEAGFFISGGSCLALSNAPVTNCLYHAASNVCALCSADHFPSGGACLAISNSDAILNCVHYATATTCLECAPGYLTTATACIPPSITSCKYYGSNLFCAVCNDVSYPQNGLCPYLSAYLLNCVEYSSATECASCQNTHFLTAGRVCASRGYGIPNCRVYTDATTCLTCDQGYFFSTGTGACVAISPGIANCLYHATPSSCQTCQPNFALSADRTACLENCEVSYFGARCYYCLNHTYESNGNCLPVTTRVPNCRIYSSATRCALCEVTHEIQVVTGQCSPRPDYALYEDTHCLYAFKETCAYCDTGFFKAFAWNDYRYTPCAAVPKVITGCKIYSQDGKACDVCDTGFFQPGYHKACVELGPKRDCYCYAGTTYNL